MKNQQNWGLGFLLSVLCLAAFSRLLPHPPNFTPVGAISLFGAAYFSRKYLAILLPILALWLSDLVLNNVVYAQQFPEFYPGFTWFGVPTVYLGFVLIVGLGWALLSRITAGKLLVASLAASVLFFLVTNAGAWWADPIYPKNAGGLVAAYTAGIPFFWNTLLGDLLYTGVLFGITEFTFRRFPAWRPNSAVFTKA
ncbi:MAG: hypothetical protein H6555_03070 [Lewinellaceae bacterium]|nr:hypothetical protein [Lewinellaceae bacterium]